MRRYEPLFPGAPDNFSALAGLINDKSPEDILSAWKITAEALETAYPKVKPSAAKYHLLQCLRGVDAPGVSDETRNGYSSQLLAAASFTCVERYTDILGKKASNFPFFEDFRDEFRRYSDLMRTHLDAYRIERITASVENRQLRREVQEWYSGDDAKIYRLMYALRNIFAHGKAGAGTTPLEIGQLSREMTLKLVSADCDAAARKLDPTYCSHV